MSESALGSVFEISLRILLMLRELFPSKLDEPQVSALDFISVYASDFGLLDENLHGYGDYRFSEYPARKHMVDSALKNLVLDGYVRLFSPPQPDTDTLLQSLEWQSVSNLTMTMQKNTLLRLMLYLVSLMEQMPRRC